MKNKVLTITLLTGLVCFSQVLLAADSTSIATSSSAAPTTGITPVTVTPSTNPKIQQFLAQVNSQLSTDFPYRMNLPNSGQLSKNDAGIRLAETAHQLD